MRGWRASVAARQLAEGKLAEALEDEGLAEQRLTRSLQDEAGCFSAYPGGERDMRFLFCATAISAMLNDTARRAVNLELVGAALPRERAALARPRAALRRPRAALERPRTVWGRVSSNTLGRS